MYGQKDRTFVTWNRALQRWERVYEWLLPWYWVPARRFPASASLNIILARFGIDFLQDGFSLLQEGMVVLSCYEYSVKFRETKSY